MIIGQIQIGPDFLQSSFSILEEQPMDMLLGLDMLKRHQVLQASFLFYIHFEFLKKLTPIVVSIAKFGNIHPNFKVFACSVCLIV